MRVWVYPEKEWAEFGAVRWRVKWQTVKLSALKRIEAAEARGQRDEVDPDSDIADHYRVYSTEKAALRAARAIVDFGKTAYGCAAVEEQCLDWCVEERRVAEWVRVGEAVYVD